MTKVLYGDKLNALNFIIMALIKAEIKKVMTSNYLYTLFFEDGTKIEIYKSYFKHSGRPKAGDSFSIFQSKDKDGTLVTDIRLNGKPVGPQ